MSRSTLSEEPSPPRNSFLTQITQYFAHPPEAYKPAIVLENKGSVARDHLANERTYLAWLRTSLSLITLGVTVAQVFRLTNPTEASNNRARGLSITFTCLGIVILLFGVWRYFSSQAGMIHGVFPSSRGIILTSSLLCMAAILATLGLSIQQERDFGFGRTE
ncbi:MAG: hypothetical protein DHS80DRAFT_16044 [Piptocephalis tieghemiana]|nr:MAG: hypothetical protein DHS80DRAFT_16044 [Piptocephalis tieghemiana]